MIGKKRPQDRHKKDDDEESKGFVEKTLERDN